MMGILVSSAGAARLELELAPLPAAAAPKKILSYPQASRPIIPTFMVLTARSVGQQGRVEFEPAADAAQHLRRNLFGRFESKRREPQPNKFYFILTVILSETIGGLNG